MKCKVPASVLCDVRGSWHAYGDQQHEVASMTSTFRGCAVAGSDVLHWVMGNLKLLLEWITIPIFVIALQLPQGAVWYWLTSSCAALAQVCCTCETDLDSNKMGKVNNEVKLLLG